MMMMILLIIMMICEPDPPDLLRPRAADATNSGGPHVQDPPPIR